MNKYSGQRLLVAGLALGVVMGMASTPAVSQHYDAAENVSPILSNRLTLLTPAQREFLISDEPLMIVPSRVRLMQELERRTPEQVRQYVSDMMAAIEALRYNPETDLDAIPLNREATNFNNWQVLRPDELQETQRNPGPFSLSRYVNQWGGIPTFARAPVAVTLEDLIVGNVEVAYIGIPQSMSSGNRDARNAPAMIRGNYSMVSFDPGSRDVYTMIDPAGVLNIVDFGDFNVDRMSLARSVDHVREMVTMVAETGVTPFFVGGDASIMYPTIRGMAEAAPDRPFTVVHLSAHHNAEAPRHHPLSDRDPVYNLLVDEVIEGKQLIQVGLRGPQITPRSLEWLREHGVRYHTMAEVERNGWEAVMARVIEAARQSGNPIYLSIDASVFDPTEVPAAGRSVPNGLKLNQLSPLVRRLCAETQLIGFEMLDLAPMMDFSHISALNSTAMFNACLSGMALRKLGIYEENYLAPISVDHGLD